MTEVNEIMKIKKLTKNDTDAFLTMERECFSDPYGGAALETLLSFNGFGYIAYDGDTAVGALLCADSAGDCEILRIETPPAHRGKGVASALMERLFSEREGDIFLEVRESNTPARSLYKKHGFTETGRRRAFYKAPTEDAIIMTKTAEIRK